ncbi:MAG: hypothetical protein ACRELZ_08945 [Candidatus Rokuibacteriota bacterium]
MLAGAATIAGIVLVSPAWQRMFVAWRAAATAAAASPVFDVLTAGFRPQALGPGGIAAQPATAPSQGIVPRTAREPAPSRPVQARPSRPPAPSDTTQVMASLLVAQLGHDPAWRTAVANADAHAADSPEHAYWRSVATAIRDGARVRP